MVKGVLSQYRQQVAAQHHSARAQWIRSLRVLNRLLDTNEVFSVGTLPSVSPTHCVTRTHTRTHRSRGACGVVQCRCTFWKLCHYRCITDRQSVAQHLVSGQAATVRGRARHERHGAGAGGRGACCWGWRGWLQRWGRRCGAWGGSGPSGGCWCAPRWTPGMTRTGDVHGGVLSLAAWMTRTSAQALPSPPAHTGACCTPGSLRCSGQSIRPGCKACLLDGVGMQRHTFESSMRAEVCKGLIRCRQNALALALRKSTT